MRIKVVAIWLGRVLARTIPVLLGATLLAFMMTNLLPGDPAAAILGDNATPEALETIRKQLHLDLPVWQQYLEWLQGLSSGDLGTSYSMGVSVKSLIMSSIPVTLEIVGISLTLAIVFAVPAALISARRRGRWQDRIIGLVAYVSVSSPHFLVAVILVLVISLKAGWLPSSGWHPIGDGLGANLQTAILPALSIAFTEFALYTRVLRTELVDQLTTQNYVVTGRSKGLTVRQVLFRHVLPNSSLPVITLVGIRFGVLMGGAVIVETVFAAPGLGYLLIQAINSRDLVVVQGIVVFVAVVFVVINVLVDLMYTLLDPRMREATNAR